MRWPARFTIRGLMAAVALVAVDLTAVHFADGRYAFSDIAVCLTGCLPLIDSMICTLVHEARSVGGGDRSGSFAPGFVVGGLIVPSVFVMLALRGDAYQLTVVEPIAKAFDTFVEGSTLQRMTEMSEVASILLSVMFFWVVYAPGLIVAIACGLLARRMRIIVCRDISARPSVPCGR